MTILTRKLQSRFRNLIFLSVKLLLLPIAAMPAYSEAKPTLSIEQYTFTTADGESVAAERGSLVVPENRQNPDSRQIKLEFVRFPSTSPNPAAPIIYLAGGPGGSGVQTARGRRFSLFMALREVADVIAFDQRGTGWSNRIPPCISSIETAKDEPRVFEVYLNQLREAAEECSLYWQKNKVDLAGYTTWESAADLDDLRRALGAEKVSLWGISYGSHLALAALKRYSANIERTVLASLEGPNETIKLPARTDAYFSRIQSVINLQPESRHKYPNLIELMHRVHEKLESEPAEVSFTNEQSDLITFTFGAYDLQNLIGGTISDPNRILRVPALYSTIDALGAQALPNETLRLLYRAMRSQTRIGMRGMAEAMDAASGITSQREKLIMEQANTGVLGNALNFPYYLLQEPLGVPDLGDGFRSQTVSSVPALFLSGTLDGRTYVESAAEIAEGFENGNHIIIENAGHNLFMSSPEIGELVVQFFKGEPVTTKRITLPPPIFE